MEQTRNPFHELYGYQKNITKVKRGFTQLKSHLKVISTDVATCERGAKFKVGIFQMRSKVKTHPDCDSSGHIQR
jgi:hypothetical protein